MDKRLTPCQGKLLVLLASLLWLGIFGIELSPGVVWAAPLDTISTGAETDEATGLQWQGSQTLEIQYIDINGRPPLWQGADQRPGLILDQRLQAEVRALWPGVRLHGTFDNDAFLPKYSLRLDMAQGSASLGDVDVGLLSLPLSSLAMTLSGAQGYYSQGPLTIAMVAGHSQTITQVEVFTLTAPTATFHTSLAPILMGTEKIMIGERVLTPNSDYFIDYQLGRIDLRRWWPGAEKLTISYQVSRDLAGKKPLIQGGQARYTTKIGTLSLTHLARNEIEPETASFGPSPSEVSGTPTDSKLTWSALAWEQGTGTITPYFGMEVWRRTFTPKGALEFVVEDMEIHTKRQPLLAEMARPEQWTRPEATMGSSLDLERETGWIPTEGVIRAALKLGFTLEGSGARAKTTLPLPTAVNLTEASTMLLTLGLPRPQPGMQLDILLYSGTNSYFIQSVSLGSIIGWQDIILDPENWAPVGIPSWQEISGVGVQLRSSLPGTIRGEIMLSALDTLRLSEGEDRWHALTNHAPSIAISTIALPHAPWMPPPDNKALRVDASYITPPSTEDGRRPQILGRLPYPFSLGDSPGLTFWAHTKASGSELVVWLLNTHGEPYGPHFLELSEGWKMYSIPLDSSTSHLSHGTITMVAMSIVPDLNTEELTVILDEWKLAGMQSKEDYMARFTAERQTPSLDWCLTGSGQTPNFRWDAPGMSPNTHPNHLELHTVFHGPSNKQTALTLRQEGRANSQASIELQSNAWANTHMQAHLTIPKDTTGISGVSPITGQLDLETVRGTTTWELSAFQKASRSLLLESPEPSTHRGLAFTVKQRLPIGFLQLGTWHMAEGASGQNLDGDIDWQLSPELPVRYSFRVHRYQSSASATAEIGGIGLCEANWQSPTGRLRIHSSLEQRQGREIQGFALSNLAPWGLASQNLWTDWWPQANLTASPILRQGQSVVGWQWYLSETVMCTGRWQRRVTHNLASNSTSGENTGSLALTWPWTESGAWYGKAVIGKAHSRRTHAQDITDTEYELSTEGSWNDNWYGKWRASQRLRELSLPSVNKAPHYPEKGQRWVLEGEIDHGYSAQGSLGLGVSLAHQTASNLGNGFIWQEKLESWDTGLHPFPNILDPRISQDESGTYLRTQLRWVMARKVTYRASFGAFAHVPTQNLPTSLDYYGQVGLQKSWGPVGVSQAELAVSLGSEPGWAVGLGWVKQLSKTANGLHLDISLRHAQAKDYGLTMTKIGLEYRF